MVHISPLSFTQYATDARERIDAALAAASELGDGCPPQLREAIGYALLAPGKRLRPMLVLMAAEACGAGSEDAMPAACAVEMVHAYSLVHDDLPAMDDDDLRRGRPTCHKAFGEAMAILAGDALLAMAFEVLAKGTRPPEVAAACCAALAEAAGACRLVGGQADDLAAERNNDECRMMNDECSPGAGGAAGEPSIHHSSFIIHHSVAALESIHNRKTGAMILVSLELGALVAGADRQTRVALAQYGRRLGLAFQITDDLLDVRGDEAALGKRVRKDSEHGKLTFPALLGVDQSARRAEQLIAEAIRAIAPLGPRAGSLEALATYVLERNQ